MEHSTARSVGELAFRLLFSSIFLALGGEHIVDDTLIQRLMPGWMPLPDMASLGAGVVLLTGGVMVAIGWRLRAAALLLGAFLVTVTVSVHLPAVVGLVPAPDGTTEWVWTILQRSNLVKNLCLLGVCVQLWWHIPGRYSLQGWGQAAGRPAGGPA
jgi:uncharacterized membrane protein YphA (DoxX/SURF4 family)